MILDFETYSEAGYSWDPIAKKWRSVLKNKSGLTAVGAWVYCEHPSARILCLGYGGDLWHPGLPLPEGLFSYVRGGGVLEAFNSFFEFCAWNLIWCRDARVPPLPLDQIRCSQARGRAWSLPAALEKVGEVLNLDEQKDKGGAKILNRVSIPQSPLKRHDGDPRANYPTPASHPELYRGLYDYCQQDVVAEGAVSKIVPQLIPEEQEMWLLDQRINARGVHVDLAALEDCISIVDRATERYTDRLFEVTRGVVSTANEIATILGWLGGRGVVLPNLDADTVDAALSQVDPGSPEHEVLKIRSILGSTSVKKLYAIQRMTARDSRIHGMLKYCGADTGRWSGSGPQPQNLVNHGPDLKSCSCGRCFWAELPYCPECFRPAGGLRVSEWGINGIEPALADISTRNLDLVERLWGDAVALVASCLRGLFTAGPDNELICSDYNSVEAIGLACLAGEGWRIEVFRTHGKIYEMSAAMITGIPFEEFIRYKKETGEHHPMRKKVGKVAELASGYQGSVGAWKNFGADEFFTDDEILEKVRAWRAASPNIEAFWYGLEEAAKRAIQYPGQCFRYRDISYGVAGDVLYCRLPSGRLLSYHRPRLVPDVTPWGKRVLKITFEGWNADYKRGPKGWMRMDTYGGKLTENVVQATCRDIMADALKRLEAARYPVVFHVHDETVSEVRAGYGSIEEYEKIMMVRPSWALDWPIRASGGWRGLRYRK